MNDEKRLSFLLKYHHSLSLQLAANPEDNSINSQTYRIEQEIESLLFSESETNEAPQPEITGQINDLCNKAHQNAINKGWYEEPKTFGECIALMHSELSEALEDHRNGRGFREIYYDAGKPCGIPTELADTVIRIFDTCGHLGIDLEEAIRVKMDYNATRPIKHGGKRL